MNVNHDQKPEVPLMTEENRPHRPNEKYKLSKSDDSFNPEKDELIFYYNREHRLAKAPQAVRDLYAKQKTHNRFNLLQPLIADKPRAMLFITIMVISTAIFLLSLFGYFNKSYTLEGNKIEISGTVFEGTTIVVLKKSIKSKSPYSGTVDIAVSVEVKPDVDMPLYYHRVFFTPAQEDVFRFVVPYDSPELLMVIQTGETSLKIKFKPE